jgi:hypothetical protein
VKKRRKTAREWDEKRGEERRESWVKKRVTAREGGEGGERLKKGDRGRESEGWGQKMREWGELGERAKEWAKRVERAREW